MEWMELRLKDMKYLAQGAQDAPAVCVTPASTLVVCFPQRPFSVLLVLARADCLWSCHSSIPICPLPSIQGWVFPSNWSAMSTRFQMIQWEVLHYGWTKGISEPVLSPSHSAFSKEHARKWPILALPWVNSMTFLLCHYRSASIADPAAVYSSMCQSSPHAVFHNLAL